MIHLRHALSARFLLLLIVLLLGHAHLGGMPVLAQESVAVVN